MKKSNKHEHSLPDRLIKLKLQREEKKEARSESTAQKFQYELPTSFIEAVDKARMKSGNATLPHFHRLWRSASARKELAPSTVHQSKTRKHHRVDLHRTQDKNVKSPSTSDNDKAFSEKVLSHRKLRKHLRHHRRKVQRSQSNSTRKTYSSRSNGN